MLASYRWEHPQTWISVLPANGKMIVKMMIGRRGLQLNAESETRKCFGILTFIRGDGKKGYTETFALDPAGLEPRLLHGRITPYP
jgi:hypothetical protein